MALIGRSYQFLGILLILAGMFLGFFSIIQTAYRSWWYVLGTGVGYSVAHFGSLLLNRGRRMLRSSGGEVALSSSHIVYLRAFGDDSVTERFSSPVDLFSEEEQLALAFHKVGPVTAIGRPGQKLPPLGATRLYVEEKKDWHLVVREAIQKSQIVILRSGITSGLLWELTEVIESVAPERLLIVISSHQVISRLFLSQLQDKLKIQLPVIDIKQKAQDCTIAGFLHFDSDWAPHFLPLRRASWHRATLVKALTPMFTKTLQPFFIKLGLSVDSRPAYEVYVLVLLAALTLGVVALLFALMWHFYPR